MLQIVERFIPKGFRNRPGHPMVPRKACAHETGSFGVGADAEAHAKYILSKNAQNRPVSWHGTNDDKKILFLHLPFSENGWHAGDGANGPGNRTTIGWERCVNIDGNREKSINNFIWAMQYLKRTVPSLDKDFMRQHWDYSKKNCPQYLRDSGRWNEVVQRIYGPPIELDKDVEVIFMIISRSSNNTHPIVKPVQEAIIFLDRPDAVIVGGAQGTIGPTTDTAIRAIQKAIKIPQDGVISYEFLGGLLTLVRLKNVVPGISKAEYDKVVSELAAAKSTITGLNKTISSNEATRKTLETELSTARNNLSGAKSELEKEKKTNSDLANEIKRYMKELKDQDDRIADLQIKVDDLQDDKDILESKLKEAEEKPVTVIAWQDASAMELIVHAIKLMFGVKEKE